MLEAQPSVRPALLTLISVIKFKNYGVDLIEVSDDGSGISPDDYDGIGETLFVLEVDVRTETLHVQTVDV